MSLGAGYDSSDSRPGADRPTFRFERGIVLRRAALPCVLATLTLLLPWALASIPRPGSYGGDLPSCGLTTAEGPSWKPLPLLFTTPLALAGDLAPAWWMILARTGALRGARGCLAPAAARGQARGRGVGAVGVTALGPWSAYNAALGNSKGCLAAFVLWAVVAHLERRERLAFVLLAAAGLLRPEIWPFLVGYGAVDVAARVAGARRRRRGGDPRGLVRTRVVLERGPDQRRGDGESGPRPGKRGPRRASRVAGARRRRHRCRARRLRRGGLRGLAPAAGAGARAARGRRPPCSSPWQRPPGTRATRATWSRAIAVLAVLAGVGAAALPWPRLGVAALPH